MKDELNQIVQCGVLAQGRHRFRGQHVLAQGQLAQACTHTRSKNQGQLH